jgi:hypothetical protein
LITEYLLLVDRIRQELADLEYVVERSERGMRASQNNAEDQDLYIDAVALNLHDFYTGCERIFQQIGSIVDGRIPGTQNWHRELLLQMQEDVADTRPPVLTEETTELLDEFLRFRHVVRNIYAFQFDPERIDRLVNMMRPALEYLQADLLIFSSFLQQVARDD